MAKQGSGEPTPGPGTTIVSTPSAPLPVTGSDLMVPLVTAALLLIVIGTVFVVAMRERFGA